jgi:hypothetical protein
MRINTRILIMAIAGTTVLAQSPQPPAPTIEPLYRFWNIRIGDVVMIVAVLVTPFAASWVRWRLELRREARDRKMTIFRTVMANRMTSIAVEDVRALNVIDV